MPVQLNDDFNMEGKLSINLVHEDGQVENWLEEDLNVITNLSKARLLAMIYDKNKSLVPDPILSFRVGDGGTLDGTSGVGGTPGSNPRPLTGAESSLFSELNTGLYSSTTLFHNLENATTADSGIWAPTTNYNINNKVSATSSSLAGLVFEASNGGTSGPTEPEWPTVVGGTVVDGDITWVARARSLYSQSVKYSFSVSPTQLNGYNISEVALYRESGDMFNIKTFASIPKSSSFSIQFIWTIRYA